MEQRGRGANTVSSLGGGRVGRNRLETCWHGQLREEHDVDFRNQARAAAMTGAARVPTESRETGYLRRLEELALD